MLRDVLARVVLVATLAFAAAPSAAAQAVTPTPTSTAQPTATAVPTSSPTFTATATPTATAAVTATATPTATATSASGAQATSITTVTATATATATPTQTASATPTQTATALPSPSVTPTAQVTFTDLPEAVLTGNEERYIVTFRASSRAEERQRTHGLAATAGAKAVPALRTSSIAPRRAIVVDAQHRDDVLRLYRADPAVLSVEADRSGAITEAPNDPLFAQQYALARVNAVGAWDVTSGSSSVNIAILDTGILLSHTDLSGKISQSIDFTGSPSGVTDVYGHGTHVAGIAAASVGNGIGVAGLGRRSSLMNIKVMGDGGSGWESDVVSGIDWASAHGAKVISMSLAFGGGCDTALQTVIDTAWSRGAVIVAAAGNYSSQGSVSPGNCNHVVSVAATDANDSLAAFSNYGPQVTVAAPGVSILSTTVDGAYGYKSGTSMATPLVAGLAGLIWSTPYGTSNQAVVDRITAGADAIAGTGTQWKYGRVNAQRSVQPAASPSPTPTSTPVLATPTTPPTATPTATNTPQPRTPSGGGGGGGGGGGSHGGGGGGGVPAPSRASAPAPAPAPTPSGPKASLPVVGAAVPQALPTPLAMTYQPDAALLNAVGGDLLRIVLATWTPAGWAPLPCAPRGVEIVCWNAHAGTVQPMVVAAPDPITDLGLPDGHFYRQANPLGGAGGYAVSDDSAAALWTDYQRLGGPVALGFPISNRFVDGSAPVAQVFQNEVLEWRADLGHAVVVDVLDVLSTRGIDTWLDQVKQIPPSSGTPVALDGQPQLQAAADRLKDVLGLPLAVKDYGALVSVRFQRGALQLHKATDTAPATVELIGGGQLAREAGLVPDAALAPVLPQV